MSQLTVSPRESRIGAGARTTLGVLCLAAFAEGWDDAALGLLAPEIRIDLGLSIAFLTSLAALTSLFVVGFGPFMGYLADRLNRAVLLRIGAITSNLGSLAFAFAPSARLVVGARSLTSVGTAIRLPVGFPLLADLFAVDRRARAFSLISAAAGIGALIGAPIAALIASNFGWRVAVGVLAIVALVVSLGFFLIKEVPRGGFERRLNNLDPAAEQKPAGFVESFRIAWSVKSLRRLAFAALPASFASPLLLLLGLYYAQEFGLNATQRAWIQSLSVAAAIAGVVVAGRVADSLVTRYPSRVVGLVGGLTLIGGVSVALIAISQNLWLSIAISLPLGFTSAMLAPANAAIQALVIPPRIRGAGLQIYAPFAAVGLLLAPIGGTIADATSLRQGLLFFVPFQMISGILVMSARAHTARDIAIARSRVVDAQPSADSAVLRCVSIRTSETQSPISLSITKRQFVTVNDSRTNNADLLAAIGGFTPTTQGAIFFGDKDVTSAAAFERSRAGIRYLDRSFSSDEIRGVLDEAPPLVVLVGSLDESSTARDPFDVGAVAANLAAYVSSGGAAMVGDQSLCKEARRTGVSTRHLVITDDGIHEPLLAEWSRPSTFLAPTSKPHHEGARVAMSIRDLSIDSRGEGDAVNLSCELLKGTITGIQATKSLSRGIVDALSGRALNGGDSASGDTSCRTFLGDEEISRHSQASRARLGVLRSLDTNSGSLTVAEICRLQGASVVRVQSVMEVCELTSLQHCRISALNSQQLRALDIARALVSHPKVLLLDNPSIGLDVTSVLAFVALTKSLATRFDTSVLVCDSDIGFLKSICHRIVYAEGNSLVE